MNENIVIKGAKENNLKNDIAMRFGNLDNSTFLNNLKKITDNKSKATPITSKNIISIKNVNKPENGLLLLIQKILYHLRLLKVC